MLSLLENSKLDKLDKLDDKLEEIDQKLDELDKPEDSDKLNEMGGILYDKGLY